MIARLSTWILNLAYTGLLCAVSPVVVWRAMRHGRYRRGIREKLLGTSATVGPIGNFPTPRKPVAWFHAVSVGEVVQLEKIVAEFRRQSDVPHHIVVTSSTDTGYDLALKRFTDCTVTWFPLDFSWSVNAAIDRIQPQLLVLMELEIWPNLIAACHRRDIPVAIVNARMSDKSVKGYRRVRRFIAPTLNRISLIAAQSTQYAERLVSLGANSDRVHVTGSIKFDGVCTDRNNPQTTALRHALGIQPHELVFIAGSTQEPEEAICLLAWIQLTKEFPHLRFISVPRHKERFDDVAAMIADHGLPLIRRSQTIRLDERLTVSDTFGQSGETPNHNGKPSPVILLDTIGELSACWGLADVAFVGGSFGNRGGQNMIEPAAYGAVIMFGPNTSNFRDVVAAFKSENACIQMTEPDDLVPQLRSILTQLQDEDSRRSFGQSAASASSVSGKPELHREAAASFPGKRAQSVVIAQQGATTQTVQLLTALVRKSGLKIRSAA